MTRNTRARWTPEQIRILAKHYPDKTPGEMNKLLSGVFTVDQTADKAKKLGIRKSDAYRARFGIGENGCRTRGSLPWNKGIRFEAGGKSGVTRFKPGSIPPNWRPVGSTRITRDGYVEIKTAEGMFKWRLRHREVWKEHHGEYSPRGTAIIFRDGNRQNCDIDNLELLTRKQLMARNSIQNYPDEIKEVTHLRASITRKINDHKKRHNGTT